MFRSEDPAIQRLGYLVEIIRSLGWDSFMDPGIIKPNLRSCQVYLRKHANKIKQLFNIDVSNINREDIVDIINPFIIEIWHVQIIGDTSSASLELLNKQ